MITRFLLLVVFVIFVNHSFAQEIGYDSAKQKAIQFFQGIDKNKGDLKSASVTEVDTFATYYLPKKGNLKSANIEKMPAFYIFNRKEKPGFVIVAADKRVRTIIAWSASKNFTKPNPGLEALLNQYTREIAYLGDNNITEQQATTQSTNFEEGTWLLKNIEWGQNPDPYNSLCPLDIESTAANGRVPAGCGATAMSQIIYYYKYPRIGVGLMEYISQDPKYGKISADFKNTTYKYELMADIPILNEANNNISTLIYHCGVAAYMRYGTKESISALYSNTVSDTTVKKGLESFFNFKKITANDAQKLGLGEVWKLIIKNEINKKRPIIYRAGETNGGGHIFIIDGYDEDERFHINWGWKGDGNNFFPITLLKPENHNYSEGHYMLTGIEPANPDLIGPQVISVKNSDKLNTIISIEFNEPIDPETINENNIVLKGEKSGIIFFHPPYYEISSKILTITPTSQFQYNERISITVKSAITDLVGNYLDGDSNDTEGPGKIFPFTTVNSPKDLAATSISVSNSTPELNEEVNVTAKIKNLGTEVIPISQNLYLYDNGIQNKSFLLTEPIQPGGEITHTFVWKATPGAHNLTVEADLVGDGNTSNNTISTKVYCKSVGTFMLNETDNQIFEASIASGTQKVFSVNLTNSGAEDISATVSSAGNYASWITPVGLSPFDLSQSITREYPFIIKIPVGTTPGTYKAAMRFDYADNSKSTIVNISIVVWLPLNLLANCEYWFDNNFDSKISTSTSLSADNPFAQDIGTSQLTNGPHTLHIRFKDCEGYWSSITSEPFVKMPARIFDTPLLAGYEYWLDDDYSLRKWVRIRPTKLTTISEINMQDVSPGPHTLYYRFRDDAGQWSSLNSDYINVLPVRESYINAVKGYRYWIDNDVTKMITQNISNPVNPYVLLQDIKLTGLTKGEHLIHFQFKDENNFWSTVTTSAFTNETLPVPPVANAGPDQFVNEGEQVILYGSASGATSGGSIIYNWSSPDGITLNSQSSATPSFIAPQVSGDTEYLIQLLVNDGINNSEPDLVKVTVKNIQQTYVPDDNFEQALINLGYDSGALDDYVPTSNIYGLASLDVSNKGINDMTGLQDFISLIQLNCGINNLTNIDLSKNINLQSIFIYSNQLNSLDVTQNTNLQQISGNNNLVSFLDLSKNPGLNTLDFGNNKLTSLDLSHNPLMTILNCTYNQISSIDLSNNIILEQIGVGGNPIPALDISKNLQLRWFYVYLTNIKSIDCSKHLRLESIDCSRNNLLSFLNLKNGNNTILRNVYAIENPNLSCIQVDNPALANTYTNWRKAANASYSSDCSSPVANAGQDQIVNENSTVTLDGSASYDPNENTLTYLWKAPIGIILNGANTVNPTFIAPEVSADTEFSLILEVTDGGGNTSSNELVIRVLQVNKAPIANGGPDQTVNMGEVVTLDGTLSNDPDGDNLTYHWTAPSGINLDLTNPAKPTFIAPLANQTMYYSIILVVGDGTVESKEDAVTVNVNNNYSPTVKCNDININLNSNGSYTLTPTDLKNLSDGTIDDKDSYRKLLISADPSVFSCLNIGVPVPTKVMVTDQNNNSSYCFSIINVFDVTPPVFTLNVKNINVTIYSGEIYTLPDLSKTYEAKDACGKVAYKQTPAPGKVYNTSTKETINLQAIDEFGNIAQINIPLTVTVKSRLKSAEIEISSTNKGKSHFEVYPNPTTGIVNIFVEKSIKNVLVETFTSSGVSVLKKSFGEGVIQIDLSDKAEGIYFINITSANEYTVFKIILKK